MSNYLRIGERPNKINIEPLDFAQEVNLLRLYRGKHIQLIVLL